MVKSNALSRQAVDVRSPDNLIAVTSCDIRGVIIRANPQDIRPPRSLSDLFCTQENSGKTDRNKTDKNECKSTARVKHS